MHRRYNTKSEAPRKLWTLDDDGLSMWAHQLQQIITIVTRDVNTGCVCWGGGVHGKSVPSTKFCCEPKTAGGCGIKP